MSCSGNTRDLSMRLRESLVDSVPRGFDLAPVFTMAILLFVAIALSQFVGSWGDAARELLLFEKTCPLNLDTSARHTL
jgi:hypothetical protein